MVQMHSGAVTKSVFEGRHCVMASMIVVPLMIRMKMKIHVHFIANVQLNNFNAKAISIAFPSNSDVMANQIVSILVFIRKHFYDTLNFILSGDDASDEINCKTPICGFGACSQICLEKKSGNYNCRCADGYSKGLEKNDTCVSNEEPLLLIASDRDLRFLLPLKQMDNEVHGRIPVSKNKIDVFDVRILPDTIFLYWITTPNRYVQKLTTTAFSSNFKRKTKRAIEQEAITIVSESRDDKFYRLMQTNFKRRNQFKFSINQVDSVENPKSLAIDWIGERIYILDAKHHQIISTDLNGDQYITIIPSGVHPIDIVVDPNSRRIFWSTLDNGILSASMDGTDKQALLERGIEWATGLTIDHSAQRLYWADQRKGTIETVLLNGKSRHIITQFKNRSIVKFSNINIECIRM